VPSERMAGPDQAAPPLVQRRVSKGGEAPTEAPPIVDEVLRSPGEPLDVATRTNMESRIGHDFSRVRIHSDAAAAASAHELDARAYTRGPHVVFGQGEYRPDVAEGRRLIAHELVHVVQQRTGVAGAVTLPHGHRGRFEAQQDAVATSVLQEDAARSASAISGAATGLQRQPISDQDDTLTVDVDEVLDGDFPVGGGIPVGAEPEGETEYVEAEEEAPDVETIQFQKKAPTAAKKRAAPAKKKDAKPAAPPKKTTRIDVDLSSQTLTITWSDGTQSKPVAISSGRGLPNTKDDPCADPNLEDSNCTPSGTFTPGIKGGRDFKNKKGDSMSWYVQLEGPGATNRGIGIHDAQPVTGAPASHGCVRVDDATARTINKSITKDTVIAIGGKAPTKSWRKAKKKAAPKPAPKPASKQ
jgi:hypothetical protein